MRAHGLRASYVTGCRCVRCRAANAAYVASRRSSPAALQSAETLRTHLAMLRQLGLGARHIARLARVSVATVKALRTGRQATVRPSTAAKLLSLRPTLARGALVKGTKTWRYVDSLQREGYSRKAIAQALGAKSHQLQLHHAVRVASALRMAAVYDKLTG